MPLDETQERFLQVLGLSEARFSPIPLSPSDHAGKPDATAKRHRMRPRIPTCRNQQGILSSPLQAPPDTFVRENHEDRFRRFAHGFNKAPMPVGPHSSAPWHPEMKNYP